MPKRDSEQTISKIQVAAREHFSTKTFTDVSLREIAKQAGITVGTLNHYFPTKEALFDDCLNELYEATSAWEKDALPRLLAAPSLEEMVLQLIPNTFRFAWKNRQAIRMRMRTVVERGRIDEQRRDQYHLPFLNKASDGLVNALMMDKNEAALIIRTMTHLIVRYAISDIGELEELTGIPGNEEATLAKMAHYLGRTAVALLRTPDIQGPNAADCAAPTTPVEG